MADSSYYTQANPSTMNYTQYSNPEAMQQSNSQQPPMPQSVPQERRVTFAQPPVLFAGGQGSERDPNATPLRIEHFRSATSSPPGSSPGSSSYDMSIVYVAVAVVAIVVVAILVYSFTSSGTSNVSMPQMQSNPTPSVNFGSSANSLLNELEFL